MLTPQWNVPAERDAADLDQMTAEELAALRGKIAAPFFMPEELFRPEDQLSADPEAMALVFSKVYDTASNHIFDSWTDKDLYRAIDAPEHTDPALRDAEILEYVDELKKRKAAREALAARSAELREKYQI